MRRYAIGPVIASLRSLLSHGFRLTWRARFTLVCIALDFLIIWSILLWWARLEIFGIYLPLGLAVLLNIQRVNRTWLARLFYLAIGLLYADTLLLSFYPLQCISRLAVAFCIGLTVALVFLAWRRGVLSIQIACYCLFPAIGVSIVITLLTNAKPPMLLPPACVGAGASHHVTPLVQFDEQREPKGRPRFLLRRPTKNDMLVIYREPDPFESKVDRLDLSTLQLSPLDLPKHSECIGAYYHAPLDLVFLVIVEKASSLKPIKYPKKLLVMSGDFSLIRQLDFPEIDYCDYNAYMFESEGRIVIQGESTFFLDPSTLALTRDDVRRKGTHSCLVFAEMGFARLTETQFVVSGGGQPGLYSLVMALIPGAGAACLLDTHLGLLRTYREAPIPGAWDTFYDPTRDELLISTMWRDEVMFVDAKTMREKRRFKIGPCIRPVAVDGSRGIGYAAECFSGDLVWFEVDSGKELGRAFVGENARTIQVGDSGEAIVGTECGIFAVRP